MKIADSNPTDKSGMTVGRITFAPGPWRWMSDTALVADYGRRRAILTGPQLETCGDDGLLRPLTSDEPNARLLAAAPDLLAALKKAVETIKAFEGMGLRDDVAAGSWALYQQSPEMKQINAAIAKAEGR